MNDDIIMVDPEDLTFVVQPHRQRTNEEWSSLKDSMSNGYDPRHPIDVCKDGRTVIQGIGRTSMARTLKISAVPVRVHYDVSPMDKSKIEELSILWETDKNIGRLMTDEDRVVLLKEVIKKNPYMGWNDNRLATLCHLSNKTVAKHRKVEDPTYVSRELENVNGTLQKPLDSRPTFSTVEQTIAASIHNITWHGKRLMEECSDLEDALTPTKKKYLVDLYNWLTANLEID